MANFKTFLFWASVVVTVSLLSCSLDDDDTWANAYANALVTVKTDDSGNTYFQLDESTTLFPENITGKLYGGKEVRALMNFANSNSRPREELSVYVNWIDSIRTKDMIITTDGEIPEGIGDNPIEVVDDWVTVLEDGYLTLRVRAWWGLTGRVHYLNLLAGVNPDNPYEVELRHDANGDSANRLGDALIAFHLGGLDFSNGQTLTLKWKTFDGRVRKAEFKPHGTSESSPRGSHNPGITEKVY